MRTGLIVLAGLVIIMIGGAGLTSQLAPSVPTVIQTADPNASAFEATPLQAGQFIFWVVTVIGNVVLLGAGLAGLLWLSNREVSKAKAMPTLEERRAAEETAALPENVQNSA